MLITMSVRSDILTYIWIIINKIIQGFGPNEETAYDFAFIDCLAIICDATSIY